ncbi:MAG: hypothetical protein EZS28_004210 [Streblomastix strix]|uniref:NrS-1 polymerase-like helicase domain-containing protein n=1 Tax=Streblomastix strix TaxID=222440 RepID=A0A5J4WZ49_9EUKA|nr:MAG: hypothetical protein EZS28_004210 [Streblomastix strix]
MEVSLLSIFSGLYGINNESIRAEGVNNIRKFNMLTVNAEKNYGQAASNGERKPNTWILVKILGYHNKDYYEQIIQPLHKKNYELKKQQKVTNVLKSIEKCEIDLKDPFTLKNILDKASNGEYANIIELVAQDLQKILKVAPCQNGSCYIVKEYDFIENKMRAVPNELKNCGEQRTSNMDAMKSIITEGSFRINEKYVPKHEAENVVNLIIVTNNLFPIKIESSDRRYVVCKCSPVHRGDLEYFTNLCDNFDTDYYDNLFTFYMTRDISSFNPRDIPMTETKKDIIRASRSPVDDVIIKHFKALLEGATTPVAEAWKPTEKKLKNYEIAIKNTYKKVKKQTNGVRQYVYQLKEKMVSIYQNMLDDEEDEEIKDLEQEKINDRIEYADNKKE